MVVISGLRCFFIQSDEGALLAFFLVGWLLIEVGMDKVLADIGGYFGELPLYLRICFSQH